MYRAGGDRKLNSKPPTEEDRLIEAVALVVGIIVFLALWLF